MTELQTRRVFLSVKRIRILVCFLFMVWAAISALSTAIDIPIYHLDGAFQTASSLFRLDSGQHPGKDFYPYIGIGPTLSLYPAFKILGSNLAASVFSAQFITLLSGWLSVAILFQCIFSPKSFSASLAGSALVCVIPVIGAQYFSLPLHNAVELMTYPGNSLRPIRSFIPYLAATFYYLIILKLHSYSAKNLLSGFASGVILLWSNDFAIVTAGLFAMLIAFDWLQKKTINQKNFLLGAALYTLATVISWWLLMSLITNNHISELLEYNFVDVRKDQWWLFAFYGDENRIYDLQDIGKLFVRDFTLSFIILLSAICIAFKTRKTEHALIAWIGLVLLCGGLVASIGGHIGGYFVSFYFWAIVVSIFSATKCIYLLAMRLIDLDGRTLFLTFLATSLSALFFLGLVIFSWKQYSASSNHASHDSNRFYVPELGGYLDNSWRDYINLGRQSADKKITEEYWGLWSAMQKNFSPWPVDSVIHALGATRKKAAEAMKQSDIIISTRYSTATEWQPWNLSENFWFYDELLTNWQPQFLSPITIVWHKHSNYQPEKSVKCDIANDSRAIHLQTREAGFYRVDLGYFLSATNRHLLMVRNNISFGADAGGYVSIDPLAEKASFPVYIAAEKPAEFSVKITGNPDHTFKISSCSAYAISFAHEEVLHKP